MLKVNQILSNWKPGDVHGLDWLEETLNQAKTAYYTTGKNIMSDI